MKFLFLMDAYETLNLETETSLLLMRELKQRGHFVGWIEAEALHLRQDQVVGDVLPVDSVTPFVLGKSERINLSYFNCLLIRKDPPVDINYYHLMHILDYLPESVIQINPPGTLRDLNEKLAPLHLPSFTPPSITTRNWKEMVCFAKEEKEIVIKPLGDCSGRGIEKLLADSPELEERIRKIMDEKGSARYMTAQAFLPAIYEGDKRLFIVDGECVGIVNRIPSDGGFMGNIHQGARCEAASLNAHEKIILDKLVLFFKKHKIFMAGVDLIGGKVTEINITSPSAVRQVNDVTGKKIEGLIVDKIIEYVQKASLQ